MEAKLWAASFTKLPEVIRGALKAMKSRSDEQHRAVASAEIASKSPTDHKCHWLTLTRSGNNQFRNSKSRKPEVT
jgi:hypothetical protein